MEIAECIFRELLPFSCAKKVSVSIRYFSIKNEHCHSYANTRSHTNRLCGAVSDALEMSQNCLVLIHFVIHDTMIQVSASSKPNEANNQESESHSLEFLALEAFEYRETNHGFEWNSSA